MLSGCFRYDLFRHDIDRQFRLQFTRQMDGHFVRAQRADRFAQFELALIDFQPGFGLELVGDLLRRDGAVQLAALSRTACRLRPSAR